jgi:IclR family pca regulon transcriptional regulator
MSVARTRPPVPKERAAIAPPAPPASTAGDPDFMLSLARGLSVIRAFGDGDSRLSIADVARRANLSRAAARRCLYTLQALGYAGAVEGGYELTPAILALGYAYLTSTPVARVAQPILERVSEDLHESSSLAVLDGDEIVYIARAATKRILSIGLNVGSRLPAACTSMGRVLLANADVGVRARFLARAKLVAHTPRTIVDPTELGAELDRVRAAGYALIDQELELGLRSIAVPVRRRDGVVIAAVNAGVQLARADRQVLVKEFLPVLERAAAEISLALAPRHGV